MDNLLLRWEMRAAALALAVLALRFLLRRRSKGLIMPLWNLLLLRLLCPLSLPAVPLPVSPPPVSLSSCLPAALTDLSAAPAVSGGSVSGTAAPPWLEILWMAGVLLLLLRGLVQRLKLRQVLRFAVREEGNIYCCDGLPSPCAAGIFRGRIYLPFHLPEEVRRYALRHERMHLDRRDPLLLFLTELAAALHWWNPLVWLAAGALREDMEMYCDELVLRQSGTEERRSYFQAMLYFAAPSPAAPCFGGTQAERRVVHMAALRPLPRPAAGGICAALTLCMLPCFLTVLPAVVPASRNAAAPVRSLRQEDSAASAPAYDEAAFARVVIDAAAQGDAVGLSALVRYPLTIRRDGERMTVTDPAGFVAAYDRIIGPEIRADLLSADPENLFANWEGLMIGQGSVWFDGSGGDGYHIIAINDMK